MIILCDMDGVICDLHGPWIDWYNQRFTDSLLVGNIHSWEMREVVRADAVEHIYDFLHKPGLYKNLDPFPGAIEALTRLHEKHRVILVSTPSADPQTAADKLTWVEKHLPWARRSYMLTTQKDLVRGDVFIDDAPHNLVSYRRAWPAARTVCVDWPYNKDVDCDMRALNWQHMDQAWLAIELYIADVERGAA
jgi:5'-nucleotidase